MVNMLKINMALTPTLHNDMLIIKKQLDLPSVMVQFSDHHRADIQPFILGEGVREEDKLPLVLLVPVETK